MDPIEKAIILQEAKNYTDSQRIAHSEHKIITYNGDSAGKLIVPGLTVDVQQLVRISKEIIDLSTVKSLRCAAEMTENGTVVETAYEEFDKSMLSLASGETFRADCEILGYYSEIDGAPLNVLILCVATEFVWAETTYEVGTYVLNANLYEDDYETVAGKAYVDTIDFGETIHPIDPKFLPDTKINLCDYGINVYEMMAQGTSGNFTVDDARDFWDRIPNDGSRLVLVTDDGANPILHDQGALTVVGQEGNVWQIASFNTLMDKSGSIVISRLIITPNDAVAMTGINVLWVLA